MTVLDGIKRLFGRAGAKNRASGAQDKILDRDADGTPLREREILSFLRDEYARRREERMPLERQWTLNASFFAGHQHCAINPASGEIQPTFPLYEHEERGVYNRIAPLIETRLSSLRALSYAMTVRPRTGDGEDLQRSEVATALLRYTQGACTFDEKKNTALLYSELYGTAFFLSRWDAGEGDGEISLSVLSPYEVFPSDLSRTALGDQESVLLAEVLSTDEILSTFGVAVAEGDPDVYTLASVASGGGTGQAGAVLAPAPTKARRASTLLTYFERPSAAHAHGRLIVAAGDKLLWYSELPYDEIPLAALKCKEAAGQFFGRSAICDLIPLQRAYNGVKNRIHDYIRAVAANPLLVPEGSIADIEHFATHGLPPGEVVEYNAERGRPEPLSPAPLPAELRYECDQLAADMEYTAGVSQLMVLGKTPSGVTSGRAIENLRKIDSARLSLSGENLREAIRSLSAIWLRLYKRFVSGYRTLAIAGENAAGAVYAFSAEDLNSTDIVFDTENELILSRESRRESFLTALQLGLFTDERGKLPRAVKRRAKEILELGSECDEPDTDELQTEAAERENAALLLGEIPTLSLFDDHALHAEAHKRFLLQARFGYLRKEKPALARAFEAHLLSHMAEAGGTAKGNPPTAAPLATGGTPMNSAPNGIPTSGAPNGTPTGGADEEGA